jgi:hypothetical protein
MAEAPPGDLKPATCKKANCACQLIAIADAANLSQETKKYMAEPVHINDL